MTTRPNILFICVKNKRRSRAAEFLMNLLNRLVIILGLVTLVFNSSSNAQDIIVNDLNSSLSPKERQELRLKGRLYQLSQMHLTLKIPHDYEEITTEIPHPACIDKITDFSSITHGYISKNKDVIIALALAGPTDSVDYEKDRALMKKLNPRFKNYDPDSVWIYNFRKRFGLAPLNSHIYSPNELNLFNADHGVEYARACTNLLLGEYRLVREIILDKRFVGMVDILYFVKQHASIDVDKLVNETKGLIYYQSLEKKR